MKANILNKTLFIGLLYFAFNHAALAVDICEANFYSTLDDTIGWRFSTWVPEPNINADDIIERFKQVASQDGFDIGPKASNGSEITLTIFEKTTSAHRGFPILISADNALESISIVTRLNPDEEARYTDIENGMCGMVARATGKERKSGDGAKNHPSSFSRLVGAFKRLGKPSLQIPDAQEVAKIRDEKTEAYSEAMDGLFQRALASGKSIVIIPSLNLDSKFNGNDLQNNHSAFWSSETSTTIWQDIDNPKNILKVGYDESSENTGLHGYLLSFAVGKSFYLVYIVNPGTYTITGDTHEVEEASMPEAISNSGTSTSSLGDISFAETKKTQFYQTQEWFDAMYNDRTIKSNYCSVEIAGGPCIGWNSSSEHVRDQISAAGWKTVTKERKGDELVVATKLSKTFASFTVEPGKVALVDGFFSEYPNADFKHDNCLQVSASQIQCKMSKYSLIRVTAHLDHIKEQSDKYSHLPNIEKALDSTEYRATKISATPGTLVSGWGQNYTLSTP